MRERGPARIEAALWEVMAWSGLVCFVLVFFFGFVWFGKFCLGLTSFWFWFSLVCFGGVFEVFFLLSLVCF